MLYINAGKYGSTVHIDRPIIERVAELAEKHAVSRIAVSLAWLMQKKICTVPIVGATKASHPEGAAAAVGFKLSKEEVTYLEEPYQPHKVAGALHKSSS
ncbi:MAG: aldo/keto reductase [Clostridiales bacterium]|nr:aldo/keto reductase [Clostridiales bacterium]